MDREATIFSFRRFGALFTEPLVARYGLLVFLLLLVVLVVRLAVNDSAETTALRRGDFPAFRSMAVIAQGAEPERRIGFRSPRYRGEKNAPQNVAQPCV